MRVITLILFLTVCSILVYSFGYKEEPNLQPFSVDFASPTPGPASNSTDAPNISSNSMPMPMPTPDPRLTERQRQWPIEREKLVKATYPLIKESSMDIDGDGKPDKLYYRIRPWEDDFEGQVKITSNDQRVIWDHEFYMGKNDLAKFLAEVLDYSNVTQWVKNFFKAKAPYAFEFKKTKIKASDLNEVQIDHAAEIHKTTAKKLRDEILSQPKNHVISYRAEWREDLMLAVYVPSLKRFICYSRGY